jgi:hypothetical protein
MNFIGAVWELLRRPLRSYIAPLLQHERDILLALRLNLVQASYS